MTGDNAAANAEVEVYSHKLFAPTSYAGAIERKDLLQRALGSSAARVVFLQAPAGHGKTTALQQLKSLCEADGCRTGWLTFDEAYTRAGQFQRGLESRGQNYVGEVPTDFAVWTQKPQALYRYHARDKRAPRNREHRRLKSHLREPRKAFRLNSLRS